MHVYEINRIAKLSNLVKLISIIILTIFISLIIFSLYLLLFPKTYLSISLRATLLGFSFMPVMLVLLIAWIYETIPVKRSYSFQTTFSLLILLSYLFLPSIIILFRYNNIISSITKSIAAVQLLLLIIGPIFKLKGINLLPIIKSIFIDFSSSNYKAINLGLFNKSRELSKSRDSQYFDKKILDSFQCSFNSCTNEHTSISSCIKNTSFLGDNRKLDILDIGGYDGNFLNMLLNETGIQVESLHCIDPNLQDEQYKKYFAQLTSHLKLSSIKFEDYNKTEIENYDLIVANHSLYSFFDKNQENIDLAINDIQKFAKNNSLIILTLGSKNSPAYEFKNSVYELIFNEKCKDITIEHLVDELKKRPDLNIRLKYTDNYVDATTLLQDEELFSHWVEYFVRVKLDIDQYITSQIKEILRFYSFFGSQLAECQKSRNLTVGNEYLLHKTGTILISTIADNVYDAHV